MSDRAYPTLATVQGANAEQCANWLNSLPPPQTDVERTVHRRMNRRVGEYMADNHPEIHNKMRDLFQKVRDICGAPPGK